MLACFYKLRSRSNPWLGKDVYNVVMRIYSVSLMGFGGLSKIGLVHCIICVVKFEVVFSFWVILLRQRHPSPSQFLQTIPSWIWARIRE